MVGWLIGWFMNWSIHWLIGWLIDSLVDLWMDRSIDWLGGWLIDWLMNWLIDLKHFTQRTFCAAQVWNHAVPVPVPVCVCMCVYVCVCVVIELSAWKHVPVMQYSVIQFWPKSSKLCTRSLKSSKQLSSPLPYFYFTINLATHSTRELEILRFG